MKQDTRVTPPRPRLISPESRIAMLLVLLSLALTVALAQNPRPATTQTGQEKRGLGLQPTPTPNKTQMPTAGSAELKPELILQTGHEGIVNAIAASPDGRLLASGGEDFRVNVWEVATGRVLAVLLGHSKGIEDLAFNQDGRLLASASSDATIKVWDLSRSRELRTLSGHKGWVKAVDFSPDGKWLASASWDETVRLWEVATGRVVHTLDHGNRVEGLAFSPNGNLVASCSGSSVWLWDVVSGRSIQSIYSWPDAANAIGFHRALAFSPDGRLLASGNPLTLEDEYRRKIAGIRVKIWEVTTGRELAAVGDLSGVRTLAFSPDGRFLAIGGDDDELRIWDVSAGGVTRKLFDEKLNKRIDFLAFSPDGRWIAIASRYFGASDKGSVIKLVEFESGRELLSLSGYKNQVEAVAFAGRGQGLASSGNLREGIAFWGQDLSSLGDGKAKEMALSPDGRWLAYQVWDEALKSHNVRIWDVSTGRQTQTIPISPRRALDFSPDSRYLALGNEKTVKLFEVATGRETATITAGRDAYETSEYDLERRQWERRPVSADWVQSVAFSPDGRKLATGGNHSTRLWDLTSGKMLWKDEGTSWENHVYSLDFSPDGRLLASGRVRTLRFMEIETGQLRRVIDPATGQLDLPWLDTDGLVLSVAFSPDGRWVAASGSIDGRVQIWEVATGRKVHTLVGHSQTVNSVAFSFDGRRLASASLDGTLRIWDVESGDLLVTILSTQEKANWLVVTPDGLFDGSPAAWNLILWRFGESVLDVAPTEAFFNEFYYPGLLAEILAGKNPKAPRNISQVDRRQPQTKLSVVNSQTSTEGTLSARTVTVRIEVAEAPANVSHPSGSGARDVRLFRNGSLVKVWRGDVLKEKNSVTLEATVPIIAGENRFTAYAFNRDNIKSSDATLMVKGAESLKRKGIAYILAVGVNQYANSAYNLNYAVADAQAFAAEMKLQQTKLNQYDRVEIISLNDKAATKTDILKSLADLSGKTQPEDAVVIYFAGHGTAQGNRFYLIPHDLGYAGGRTQLDNAGLKTILEHSISDEELERAVEGIDAAQLLMVIDACNSGQALEAEEKRRGPMNSKGLAQLAYEKGMYILTAAQSYQAALEAAKLGHGYLTYALVEEGLKTNSSDRAPKDGQVLVREWLDFATARVPEMQLEKIEEQRKLGRELGLLIKFVESDAGNDRNVQRPRVFYRRETETSPLIVAKP